MVLRDVVVVRAESGAPSIELRGEAAAVAAAHGVGSWMLSLSHAAGIATATALALR
jgi:holo-[acyl-carrier protein] synthase